MAPPSLPPGFRFHPTDEELVAYYLKRKCCGAQFYSDIIGELHLYKYEPWDLPGLSLLPSRDQQWYFFNLRDKKYPHSSRTNRATGTGYWKATGKDRIVLSGTCKIGMKKTLVFYIGRAPQGERTDWIMHEYRLFEDYEIAKAIAGSYVVCRIYKKSGLGPRNGEQYGAPVEEGDDPIEDVLPGIEVDGNEQGSLVHMSSELQLISNKSNILKETHAKKSSFPEVIGHVDNPFGKFVSNKSVDNLLKSLFQEDPNEIQHADLILNGWDVDLNLQNGLNFQKQDMNFQILNSPFVPNQTKLDIDCANNFDDIHNILHPLADEEEMLEELLFQAEHKPSMDLKLASETKNAHAPEPLDYDDILKGDFLELADLEIPCIHPSTTLLHREEWPIMFEHPGYLFGPTDNVSHGYIQDGYSFYRGATIQSPEIFECATKGDLLYGAPNNSESQESHQLGNTVSSITSANGKNPNLEVRTSSNASFQMCTELKLPHLSKISSNFDEALMQRKDKQPRSENCCLSNMPVLLERPHYNVV